MKHRAPCGVGKLFKFKITAAKWNPGYTTQVICGSIADQRTGGNCCWILLPSTLLVMDGHRALMALPLELIDDVLSFISWPFDLHPLLLVNHRLSSIAERALYRSLDKLPAQRSVRLLLSLANAPAARRELVKALKVNFAENRVLFALEQLIARVLGQLPRLRTLVVEVSVHENNNRALAWIFPRDAPFRLRSFETSIRCVCGFYLFFIRAR
jgi:hypothetical protein